LDDDDLDDSPEGQAVTAAKARRKSGILDEDYEEKVDLKSDFYSTSG
jgi:hypothetical protein